jgi:hypothetical protein
VIVCLPAEGGPDWPTATTTVAGPRPHWRRCSRSAEGCFASCPGSPARRLLGAVRRHGLVTHPGGGPLRRLSPPQAGLRAYATCHMLAASCGQAMLTTDGRGCNPRATASPTGWPTCSRPPPACTSYPAQATVVALTTWVPPARPVPAGQAHPNWQVGLAKDAPPTHRRRAK